MTNNKDRDILCKVFCFTQYFHAKRSLTNMFEKDMTVGLLLDFYGEILTEHKRNILDMYYNEDFSLSEIAEQIGISRQGVRDAIVKASNELRFYEEKLGLANRFSEMKASAEKIRRISEDLSLPEDLTREIEHLETLVG